MSKRRVVITGLGFVTPFGHTANSVLSGLLSGKSTVTLDPEYVERGFRSQVSARVLGLSDLVLSTLPDRSSRNFHGIGRTIPLGHVAAELAVVDSGLSREDIAGNPSIGCIVGTGGPSTEDQVFNSCTSLGINCTDKIGTRSVPPTMSSGLCAVIATDYHLQGITFSVTSACATSAHAIGEAAMKIQFGLQDVMLAGGADDAHWTKSQGFDAMKIVLCRNSNDRPAKASRAFDVDRSGFVEGEAGAVIVLESYEHAVKRGARIYAEVIGYSTCSNGDSMAIPSRDGIVRCISGALASAGLESVDYVNAHATSTGPGDLVEMEALADVFKKELPLVTSTKSQTGHALGGAGAAEMVYSILMARSGVVGPSANIDRLDPKIAALGWNKYIPRIATEANIKYVLSNSFGFGGTNVSLVVEVWK